MATYEFRCRTCDTRFEVQRPMAEASAPATCPAGHDDTVKLLSSFASMVPGALPSAPAMVGGGVAGGGGCCGGGCGCG